MHIAYVRISHDPSGLRAGVDRQREDCTRLAATLWPDATLTFIEDNDQSAYKATKRRVGYEQLLKLIADETIEGLVIYNLDRLHRQPRELEAFIDLCTVHKFTHIHSVQGDIDLSTHDGQLMARIMGAVAKKESDDKSRRMKDSMRTRIAKGRYTGPRPYGYNWSPEGDLAINATEAETFRSIHADILSGVASQTSAARFMGKTQGALHTMLGAPVRAGFIGRPRVNIDSQPTGNWPPILTVAEYVQMQAFLSRHHKSPGKSLLGSGGLLECGKCGSPMNSMRKDREHRYSCRKCFLSIVGSATDDFVTAFVLREIYALPSSTPAADTGPTLDLINTLTADIELTAGDFASGALTRAEWTTIRAGLTTRLDTARSTLDAQERPDLTEPDALHAKWHAANSHDYKTWLIRQICHRIVILPTTTRRRVPMFDESRIRVERVIDV
jgi:site-specific DNA recombinase